MTIDRQWEFTTFYVSTVFLYPLLFANKRQFAIAKLSNALLSVGVRYSIGKLPSETEGRDGNVVRSVQGCPLVICIVGFKVVSERTEVTFVVNQLLTSYYVGVDKDY